MSHLTPEELSGRMDGALGGAALERVERHLAECARCREALAALAAQDALLGPALEHDPGESYFETFGARVEDRIRAAGLRGAQARLGGDRWLGWLRSPRRLAWAGAAAVVVAGAAVVLVTARLEPPATKPEIATLLERNAAAPGAEREAAPREDARPREPGVPSPPREERPAFAPDLDEARDGTRDAEPAGRPDAGAPAAERSRTVAPEVGVGATTSRLMEARRTAGGEDVPVRPEPMHAPTPAKQHLQAQSQAEGEARILKPGARPMAGLAQESTAGPSPAGAEGTSPPRAMDLPAAPAGETRLCGRVHDPQGRPVPGAVVALADLGRAATADAGGRFCLSAPAGTHELTAIAVGYGPMRLQVRAEGETADVLVTLSPVPVLGPAGTRGEDSRPGLQPFAGAPDEAFTGLSGRARSLLDEARRLTSRARAATQLDAAAAAWQRLAAAVPAGAARVEALRQAAETRTRAWQSGPTERRAGAARAAVRAYLQVAPEGPERRQAERWQELLGP
jgi:hypothetical protein